MGEGKAEALKAMSQGAILNEEVIRWVKY